jgi:hypothetical protein
MALSINMTALRIVLSLESDEAASIDETIFMIVLESRPLGLDITCQMTNGV